MTAFPKHLPGADLIERGMGDFSKGILSCESLLIHIAYSRLQRAGLSLPKVALKKNPESMLYQLAGSHSAFNGFIRRLTSFESTFEKWSDQTRINPSKKNR